MATDPFDSLRTRLTTHITRRRGLGVLGLLGMANMALPGDTTAKKKHRKRKKRKKSKKKSQTTTPTPATASATTRAPGTCGAHGSNCGTAETPCVCLSTAADVENVRCVSLVGLTLGECSADSDCTGGKVCVSDLYHVDTACLALCPL